MGGLDSGFLLVFLILADPTLGILVGSPHPQKSQSPLPVSPPFSFSLSPEILPGDQQVRPTRPCTSPSPKTCPVFRDTGWLPSPYNMPANPHSAHCNFPTFCVEHRPELYHVCLLGRHGQGHGPHYGLSAAEEGRGWPGLASQRDAHLC